MTQKHVIVERGSYRDSITLLKISNEVSVLKGIKQAAATMATPLNKRLLRDTGFQSKEIEAAGPEDLIIAVEGEDSKSVETGVARIQELLDARVIASGGAEMAALPANLDEALAQIPDANLALISVPGEFASREAAKALTKGLNVFLFSSNVPIEKEVDLKKTASSKGLLMMGPDCGTAIINGIVLGFGNVVKRGKVGLVSASGTGLQQVSTLVSAAELGISQAIGTGGKDLTDEVRGSMTIRGIKLLASDPSTDVIVLISKPPDEKTMARAVDEAGRAGKPVVLNFLGRSPSSLPGNCVAASTLEEASSMACQLASGRETSSSPDSLEPGKAVRSMASKEAAGLSSSQKYVRGLYSGGTLCYEAQVVMRPLLGAIASNAPLAEGSRLKDADKSVGNTCVDLGAEEFVVGRAHPMMDYTIRKLRIVQEAKDPGVAVILLDVVLGYGSNPDPAGQLIPAIKEASEIAVKGSRRLSFVASIVGTDDDPQGLAGQSRRLKSAGVVLMPSNAGASLLAALIAARGGGGGQDAGEAQQRPKIPGELTKPGRIVEGARPSGLLGKELKVINIGVGTFADDLRTQGVRLVSVDWKPPAGGDAEVLDLLDKLR